MFKHILVPLDGSALAEGVLSHVITLAKSCEAQVTLLSVVEQGTVEQQTVSLGQIQPPDPLDVRIREAERRTYLKLLAERLKAVGVETRRVVQEGRPAECIIKFAHSHDVDLIALSSHGRSGLSGWNISSVPQKVVMRANVSIMIVRAYQSADTDLVEKTYHRVLMPLDGSTRDESVLPLIAKLRQAFDTRILLAHAIRKYEMPRRTPLDRKELELAEELLERNRQGASQYLKKLRSALSSEEIETKLLVSDDITNALHKLARAEEVDLVVISAHGYAKSDRWAYGNLAANFISYGSTSLLIVREPPASPTNFVWKRASVATASRPDPTHLM